MPPFSYPGLAAKASLLVALFLVAWGAGGCTYLEQLRAPADSAPTARVPPGRRVLVCDRERGIVAVRVGENRIAESYPTAGGVAAVALSPDGGTVYATCPRGSVTAFHRAGDLAGRVAVGKSPYGLAVAPDGRLAYVANQASGDVSVIDLASRRELRRFKVGAGPYDVVVSPAGTRIWVSLHAAGAVVACDPETGQIVGRVSVGLFPYRMALDPDGRFLYVAVFDNNDVAVVNRDTMQVEARVKAGDGPYAVAVGQSGRIYVTSIESGTVSVVQRGTWGAVQEFAVGARPYGLALSPDESLLYVALEGESRLSVRSGVSLAETASVALETPPTEVVVGAPARPPAATR